MHPAAATDASRLKQQFEREKDYADQLKSADRDARRKLYKDLYAQLFTEFGDLWPSDNQAILDRGKRDCKTIRPLLSKDAIFVEVGCGTGGIAPAIAPYVKEYIGLDVADSVRSSEFTNQPNITFTLYDGVDLPLEKDSVDIVYSNQVLEHLHIDDARHICMQAYHILKPGGMFILKTPNRLTGPHDISRHFSSEAEGLHLYEYTLKELSELLKECSFSKVRKLWAEKGVYAGCYPVCLFTSIESAFAHLPHAARKPFIRSKLADLLINPSVIAVK